MDGAPRTIGQPQPWGGAPCSQSPQIVVSGRRAHCPLVKPNQYLAPALIEFFAPLPGMGPAPRLADHRAAAGPPGEAVSQPRASRVLCTVRPLLVRRQALRYGIVKCNIFTCNNMKTKPWPCYMAIAIVRPGPPLLSRVNPPVGLPEAAAPARRGSRCRTPKRKRTAPASPEAQLRGLEPAGASPSHPRVQPFVSRSPPVVAQSPPSASLTLPSNNVRWCIESKSPNRFEAAKKETCGPCRRIGVPPKR